MDYRQALSDVRDRLKKIADSHEAMGWTDIGLLCEAIDIADGALGQEENQDGATQIA